MILQVLFSLLNTFKINSCVAGKRFLASMAHNAGYKDKVIIRKVVIDDYDYLRDFEGNKVSADDFSERFSIQVTPTLVFMDHKGNPLTKKMLGYNRSDFFSVYLDEAIDKAKTLVQ